MITLLSIRVQGFCSIVEPFYLNLNQGCTILIKGPNGFGKTSIFSALVWGLYGKSLKGVSEVNTWKEYQPKDYSGTIVEVFFQKGSSVFKVTRCQKCNLVLEDGSKGKDRLIFLKDNELVNVKGKLNIQDEINKELGLSYTLFMNSIMFGQGIKRLIQESNSDKKKIFEEIFDLGFLNIAKNVAIEEKNHILSEVNEVERSSAILKKELESNIEAYKDLKAREKSFLDDNKARRKELKKDRKRLLDKRSDIETSLSKYDESELLKIKDSYEKDLCKYRKQLKGAKEESSIPLEDFIDHIYDLLKGKKYKEAEKSLMDIKHSFLMVYEANDAISELSGLLSSINSDLNMVDRLKTNLGYIDEDLSTIKKELIELKKEKLSVISPKYKSKIADIRSRLRKIDEDYHNKELELSDYNWLIDDPLGNNGIKAYLFDSSLDLLNRTLGSYSEVLGFRIEFSIDLNSARKEFVTLIERDGHIIDYDELSGGEKQLTNIAMAFAMNESLTASKGINIAFLDEVFESLSSDNIELVISLIKHIFSNKTLFLITHHDSLPISNSKILQVEKANGLSNYKVL